MNRNFFLTTVVNLLALPALIWVTRQFYPFFETEQPGAHVFGISLCVTYAVLLAVSLTVTFREMRRTGRVRAAMIGGVVALCALALPVAALIRVVRLYPGESAEFLP